jgi:type II secretory pathway component PulJ
MRTAERGTILLEAMIALTLLLLAGVSVVSLLGASLRSEAQFQQRETEMDELDRLLAGMCLLSRADLDRRLGRHAIGEFVADVQRPERRLYRIAVSRPDSRSGGGLVTVVYRPALEHP